MYDGALHNDLETKLCLFQNERKKGKLRKNVLNTVPD